METQATEARQRRATLHQQAEITTDEELTQKIVQLDETLVTLTADEANLRLAANTAAAAVSAGEALAARFQERQLATTALGKLQETEAAMGARRESLAAARRAQQVLPARSAFNAATEQHQQQVAQVEKATAAAAKANAALTKAAAAFAVEEARAPERSEAATELNRLEGLRAATARLVEAESVRVAAVKARDKARNLFDALDRDARTQAEKRKALAASLEKIAPLAATAEMLKRDIAAQEDRLNNLKKLVEAEKLGEQAKKALASADQAMTKAGEGLDLARKHRDALDLAWRTGQAAVLARHLVDGGPCPVCGSEEHPHPAEDTDAIPADAEIEAAKTAFTSAEAALERSRTARTLAATNATTQTATFDTLRSALGLADGAPLPAIKPATEAIASSREQEKQATAAQKEMDTQKSSAPRSMPPLRTSPRSSTPRVSPRAGRRKKHPKRKGWPTPMPRPFRSPCAAAMHWSRRWQPCGQGSNLSNAHWPRRALPTKRPRQMSQRARRPGPRRTQRSRNVSRGWPPPGPASPRH
ncbi:MAG: hypothetical protein IPI44_17260 [Sulfuritalea sp.]|nr:hypothetical protein [Sulfuritalea sp.]